MVRMTDLVRGRTTTPPAAPAKTPEPTAAPPASSPPATQAPPADAAATRTPRLNLRALANSAPDRSAPAEAPRPAPAPIDAADEVFARILLVLEHARGLVKSGEPFPWTELQRAIERAITALTQSGELFWIANSAIAPAGTDPIGFHQARVAVLALRVGQNVGLDGASLVGLGMAGTLVDVGLWPLGEGGRRLDPQSPEYRAHPRTGAEIVRRWEPPMPSIPDAIAQHHELEQGQGYPQGLKGDAIHRHAKILGLVDRYAQLTGSGGARGRSRPYEAIRDIVRSKNEEFSPALIKAFLGEISVFPPGTPVRLNTGEIARVIGVNRNHPLRPKVEVVSDAKGHPLAARMIDLSETPFVYITGPATEPA
jgi:hypothetical protein